MVTWAPEVYFSGSRAGVRTRDPWPCSQLSCYLSHSELVLNFYLRSPVEYLSSRDDSAAKDFVRRSKDFVRRSKDLNLNDQRREVWRRCISTDRLSKKTPEKKFAESSCRCQLISLCSRIQLENLDKIKVKNRQLDPRLLFVSNIKN